MANPDASPNEVAIPTPSFRALSQRNSTLPWAVLGYKERFTLKISNEKVSVKDNTVLMYALAQLLNPPEGQVLCNGHGNPSKKGLRKHADESRRLMSK